MTALPDAARLTAVLTDRLGVSLSVRSGTTADGAYVDVRPADLPATEGFVVRTILGWRHVRVQFQTETYARQVLREMANAGAEQRARFAALAALVAERGGRTSMVVNKNSVDPLDPRSWPPEWRALELVIERTPLMIDHDDAASAEEIVVFWGGSLLGMAVSLLPFEEIEPEESLETRGLPEGARERIEVNRYERNRINRTLCIAIHGSACLVCNFDFVRTYGDMGRDFIHVHHVVPVSKLGPGYVINPAADLVPVCPNCHAMLHRRDPPYSVEELREQMKSRRSDEPR